MICAKLQPRPELLNTVNGNAGTLRIDGKFDGKRADFWHNGFQGNG